jgi:molybdate transport system permease protein
MKPAMEDLIAAYRDEPGAKGISITATYGASGNFCAQIQNGAPFDLFYSADTTYPAELVKSGQGLEGTQRVYARGALVLWAPREGGPDVAARGAEILKDPSVQHIAIANPKVAPYGRAAEAALNSLGLNDAAAAKLVLGENVEQTAQFAQTGAAQAAFLPLSLVTTPAMSSSGSYWTVPTDKYPAIEHGVVVTGRGERADRARACTTAVLLVVGAPLAHWLAFSTWRGKFLVEAVVAMPLVLPPTVLGLCLLVLMRPAGPVGGAYRGLVGRELLFSFEGLLVASVVYSLPFAVQPMMASFAGVNRRLIEAAWCLGASRWRTFWRVVLRLSIPGVVGAAAVTFAHTLGEFGVVLMVGGNIPGRTRTASISVYDAVQAMEYGAAARTAAVLIAVSFVSLIITYGWRRRAVRA